MYRTNAKIECSMNDAANLADQNMQNMLSFVRVLTKKSLYLSFSTLNSIKRLEDSNKIYRLCIIYDKDRLISVKLSDQIANLSRTYML